LAYIDRLLQPGEELLARTRPHWIVLIPPLGTLVVAFAVVIGDFVIAPQAQIALVGYGVAALLALVGLLHLFARWLVRATTEYGVTSVRVVQKRGIISLHTIEMNLDKVESVDVDQGLLGRLLNYGAVEIHGVGSRWDPIVGIEDPLGFRSAITTHLGPSQK
jgi:membrane protein YdbS with pleckstrin-like domain